MFSTTRFDRRGLVLAAFVAALSLGPSGVPAAAGQGGAGSVTGAVLDELGGVLPGVTVTVRDAARGLTRSTVTDAGGGYEIAGLPAGDYEVEARLAGFLGESSAVTVGDGAPRALNLTLAIAPLAETVTVTRSDQRLASVPNAVAVVGAEALDSRSASRRSTRRCGAFRACWCRTGAATGCPAASG